MHHSIPTISFTQQAFDEMLAERATLEVEQKAVIVRLQTAREMGDLSENGAYKYAKFELGNVRRRLGELNRLLKQAVVISPPKNPQQVVLGCTVTLESDSGINNYKITNQYEADPGKNKISSISPIGRQLHGKKVGELIRVQTSKNEIVYTIIAIE